MTVGTKVKQALASLKGVQADFETFAMETNNKDAKELWSKAARQCDELVAQVEARVETMEQQEPQYKGF